MTHRQQGFTLLEMLVALSLTGLMLVLIGSALTTSNHTLLISEHYADRLNEMRTAQVYLRRTLQQTLPVSLRMRLVDRPTHRTILR